MPMSGKFAFSAYAGRGPETGFEEIHGHAVAPRDGRKRTTMEGAGQPYGRVTNHSKGSTAWLY